MAIGESERLSCIEGARSALERTATGLVAVLFVPLVAAKNVAAATWDRRKAGKKQPPQAAKEAAKRKKQPQSGKGFNWIREKVLLGCADSRFAKP